MPLEAFSPTSRVVGILTGGVTAVDRSLLLSHGTAQTRAARSIQNNFGSRIDAALARGRSVDATLSNASGSSAGLRVIACRIDALSGSQRLCAFTGIYKN